MTEIIIQHNGEFKSKISFLHSDKETLEGFAALVMAFSNSPYKSFVVVPNKLINFIS